MNNYSRTLLLVGAMLALSVLPLFANGQNESNKLSGTISSIQPASSPNMVTVVLDNKYGNVSVTVSQSVVTALSLNVGQTVNLDGTLYIGPNGTRGFDPTDIEAGGQKLQITQKQKMVPEQEMAQHTEHHAVETEHEATQSRESSGK